MENKIEIIARALILKGNTLSSRKNSLPSKILLCKMEGDGHYFLPKNLKMALFTYFKNKKFFWKNLKLKKIKL